jgi:hypothetical protein
MVREEIDGWLEHFWDYCKRNYAEAKNWLAKHPDNMHALGHTIEAASLCFIYIPPPAIVSEQDLGLTATTTEAMAAMNASCVLSFSGVYPQAFHSLRQTLEMSVICSNFVLNYLGSGKIREWREGKFRSPRFSECIEKIASKKQQTISLGLFTPMEYRKLYSRLSSWSHLHRAGHEYFFTPDDSHPHFDETAFEDWVLTCIRLLKLCIIVLLIPFPSYTLELPEWEIPDAWAGPWNWTFPKPEYTTLIQDVLGEQLWLSLRSLSDNDPISKKLKINWEHSGSHSENDV